MRSIQKDRKYNDQKIQERQWHINTTQKTKDGAARIPLKTVNENYEEYSKGQKIQWPKDTGKTMTY